MEQVELRLFGDYQRWSVLEDQCISPAGAECEVLDDGSAADGSEVILNQVRDWNDTFGVRAGASYFFSDAVEGIIGAGYASNGIPSSTLEPALMDFHSISAALGGRFRLSESLHLATTYTQLFYVSRDVPTGESIHPDLPAKAASRRPPGARPRPATTRSRSASWT